MLIISCSLKDFETAEKHYFIFMMFKGVYRKDKIVHLMYLYLILLQDAIIIGSDIEADPTVSLNTV